MSLVLEENEEISDIIREILEHRAKYPIHNYHYPTNTGKKKGQEIETIEDKLNCSLWEIKFMSMRES